MKLQYLGTAAAEGVPALFCECEVCRKSRAAGGRNIRTRSQAIIDGKILIDFPADTYMHSLLHGIDLAKIHTCVITHNHSDHLYVPDFEFRFPGFSHIPEEPLTVYGTYPTYKAVIDLLLGVKAENSNRIAAKRISEFEAFDAEGYTFIPLKAAHDPNCDPVFYIIRSGGKTMLYANDTGWFPEETWEWLENNPMHFDLVSLDCTMAPEGGYRGHMGIRECAKVRERLTKLNMTDEKTSYILHHFSHNAGFTYDEFVSLAGKEGFAVSYDGMTVEF